MNFILASIWFLMPAYFANMAPVFANKLLNNKGYPINVNLFGDHKTYRGFIFGIISAIIILYLQEILFGISFFNEISLLLYDEISILLYGFLFGFGALFGDLVKSFFKRKLNISPGKPFVPFDQIDYVIGALLFLTPVFTTNFYFYLLFISISFFLNIIVNWIGYKLKFKETYN